MRGTMECFEKCIDPRPPTAAIAVSRGESRSMSLRGFASRVLQAPSTHMCERQPARRCTSWRTTSTWPFCSSTSSLSDADREIRARRRGVDGGRGSSEDPHSAGLTPRALPLSAECVSSSSSAGAPRHTASIPMTCVSRNRGWWRTKPSHNMARIGLNLVRGGSWMCSV